MKFADIQHLIAGSSPGDWTVMSHQSPEPSASSAWTLTGAVGPITTSLSERVRTVRAAFRPNVNIAIVHEVREPTMPIVRSSYVDDPTAPAWTRGLNSTSTSTVRVIWCDMVIEEHQVVSVDGGTAILPQPRSRTVSGALQPSYVVTDWQVDVARVVHCFARDAATFHRYLSRVGFSREFGMGGC